tara:strand:+ start:277 stop:618 length:342 start_codon:yes stop_codon:yes gene_type:complete
MAEKNKKKAYFIKKIIRTLGLKNAQVLDTAINPNLSIPKKFDIITARALASTPKIIKISQHLLNPKGKFILMKGLKEKVQEEVVGLDNNKYSYTIHKIETSNQNRHILEIKQK